MTNGWKRIDDEVDLNRLRARVVARGGTALSTTKPTRPASRTSLLPGSVPARPAIVAACIAGTDDFPSRVFPRHRPSPASGGVNILNGRRTQLQTQVIDLLQLYVQEPRATHLLNCPG